MARKLKKSGLANLKQSIEQRKNDEEINRQRQEEINRQKQEEMAKLREICRQAYERAKTLMRVGQVADALGIYEQLLAHDLAFTPEAQNELRETLRYFVERSMKRMGPYPNILRFMGKTPLATRS